MAFREVIIRSSGSAEKLRDMLSGLEESRNPSVIIRSSGSPDMLHPEQVKEQMS